LKEVTGHGIQSSSALNHIVITVLARYSQMGELVFTPIDEIDKVIEQTVSLKSSTLLIGLL
jgi:hypothetical protein